MTDFEDVSSYYVIVTNKKNTKYGKEKESEETMTKILEMLGKLELKNANKLVMEVFEMTGFAGLLTFI